MMNQKVRKMSVIQNNKPGSGLITEKSARNNIFSIYFNNEASFIKIFILKNRAITNRYRTDFISFFD